MPDIFISYNHGDRDIARCFAETFEGHGLSVWWDATLHAGEAYDAVTEKELREARAVVVLWSSRSVDSRWVRAEATLADRNGTLIPAMIEACERPIMFELTQTAELSHWKGSPDDAAWLGFLADVKRAVEAQGARATSAGPGAALGAASGAKPGKRTDAPSLLAVLPFTNRSGLPEDDVFADGMVEDVIAALSQGVNVRVLASAATAGLRRGAFTDLAAVGRRLGAQYLLEGNVRRAGHDLRVTTQVLEAETGAVLWTGRFERPISELAALQEELVVDVAATLEIKLQTLELQRALKKPGDITAWEAVMRANAAQRQADPMSLMLAIEEARRAMTIAPDYAVAHAQLAQATGVLYLYASPDDPAAVGVIRTHVDHALALGSDDLFVVGLVSQALNCISCHEEALPHALRAVRKAPNLGPLYFGLGWTYCMLNRPREALASFRDADRLMPEWAFLFYIRALQANALMRLGWWKKAEAALDECHALNPDYDATRAMKAVICRRSGRHAEARAMFAPVAGRGVPLEQVLTFTRRAHVNSPALDEMLTGVRALWAETSGARP